MSGRDVPMEDDLRDEHEEAMIGDDEAEEVVQQDGDAAMDSGEEDDGPLEEIALINDSIAHFDGHKDSIFCIAQHPTNPNLILTGGGDDTAFLWDSTPPDGPLLPQSYESNPQPRERKSQNIVATLGEQDESVNAVAFTLPKGEFAVTATLAGKVNVYSTSAPNVGKLVASAKEVEEINWLQPSPNPAYPNSFAFGASDGSVWVYTIEPATSQLTIVQTFFLHQGACTAGSWTPDGKLLCTVSDDSSLYVWDAFGDAAAAGLADATSGSQAVVGLTADDERFKIDGGLYSVAVSPGGGIVAVGGAEGQIRIVGLPRLSLPAGSTSVTSGVKGGGARSKAGGGKQAAAPGSGGKASAGQAGQILASLQAQSDGVETLDFSQPPLTLLAAGSVDGSIALFDAAHNFAVRRHIKYAHTDDPETPEAVIRVEFVKSTPGGAGASQGTEAGRNWLLTSCGNDGVVRRWDVRGGTAAAAKGLVGEWRGHRGGGEGGGILALVQGAGGRRIVTAGDDGVSLVFNGE
ncbi:WD40 repeat-like protein [Polychaeton citri CBS 116435]|uniref:WD40 repeat-like protein n=1 Tax=Polychaeton citri CBS 116435 TaxID=1314669 RepID=A0A9P4UPP3_9PEZI|nr:WD40 repeat-like protein [Polychaeton citri CBS 116435]